MTAYLDGECDITEDTIVVEGAFGTSGALAGPKYCGGKVSYLGGHSYNDKLGQRLFLNALFEADCVTNPDWAEENGESRDSDGDNVPDVKDEFPNDAKRCGDSDGDTCDDCSVAGTLSTANDGPDADGDGICDAGEGRGDSGKPDGGCGCHTSGGGLPALILLCSILFGFRRRRIC